MKIETIAAALLICAAAPFGARAQVVEDVIHSFTGGADGANPGPTLLVDSGGSTGKVRAVYGSSSYDGGFGQGTAFQLVPPHGGTKVWTDTPLWTFTGGVDGDEPYGNLIAQTKHVSDTTPIYGTTSGYGGGNGSVFSLTGTTLTTLYTFTGGDDGANPFWGVVADKSGALYTAPSYAGANGCGTVIQLVPPGQGQTAWTENTIYSFTGGADGCNPNNVVIDAKGNLFGTSAYGGNAGGGTVFELIPPSNGQTGWTEQTIWGFQGGTDGASSLCAADTWQRRRGLRHHGLWRQFQRRHGFRAQPAGAWRHELVRADHCHLFLNRHQQCSVRAGDHRQSRGSVWNDIG